MQFSLQLVPHQPVLFLLSMAPCVLRSLVLLPPIDLSSILMRLSHMMLTTLLKRRMNTFLSHNSSSTAPFLVTWTGIVSRLYSYLNGFFLFSTFCSTLLASKFVRASCVLFFNLCSVVCSSSFRSLNLGLKKKRSHNLGLIIDILRELSGCSRGYFVKQFWVFRSRKSHSFDLRKGYFPEGRIYGDLFCFGFDISHRYRTNLYCLAYAKPFIEGRLSLFFV